MEQKEGEGRKDNSIWSFYCHIRGKDDFLQKKMLKVFMEIQGQMSELEQAKCICFHLLEAKQGSRLEITRKSQISFMKIREDAQPQIRSQKLNKRKDSMWLHF